MGEPAISGLNVAITCSRKQYLTRDQSNTILYKIHKQVIADACSPQQGTERPTFNAEPRFEDGALKLECDNVYTLAWLKETIRKLTDPSCPSLEVKSQSEVQKRTDGTFAVPDQHGVYKGKDDIKRTLCYQNPGIDFDRLEFTHVSRNIPYDTNWDVRIIFPEDQKRALENAGCKLSIGLTVVNVHFAK